MILDTVASMDIIDRNTFGMITHDNRFTLQPSSTHLFYGSEDVLRGLRKFHGIQQKPLQLSTWQTEALVHFLIIGPRVNLG